MIDAEQAKLIYNYRTSKYKLHKTNAQTRYNKIWYYAHWFGITEVTDLPPVQHGIWISQHDYFPRSSYQENVALTATVYRKPAHTGIYHNAELHHNIWIFLKAIGYVMQEQV